MLDNAQLWQEVVHAGGAKRIAHLLGRHVSRVYAWVEGEHGLLDWFEAVVEMLALRPGGRDVLVRLHYWSDEIFRRALNPSTAKPLPIAELRAANVRLLREVADVMEHCNGTASRTDCQKLIREALEAREVLGEIIAAAEQGVIEEAGTPRLRAAR